MYVIVNMGHISGPHVTIDNDTGIYESAFDAMRDAVAAAIQHENVGLVVYRLSRVNDVESELRHGAWRCPLCWEGNLGKVGNICGSCGFDKDKDR